MISLHGMELIEGESFTEYCRSRSLSLRKSFHCRGNALALDYAQAGVIHRDVKPAISCSSAPARSKSPTWDCKPFHLLRQERDCAGNPNYMSRKIKGIHRCRSDIFSRSCTF